MSELISQFIRKNFANGYNPNWLRNVQAEVRIVMAENDALRKENAKLTSELKKGRRKSE